MDPAAVRIIALTAVAFPLCAVAYLAGSKTIKLAVVIFAVCWAGVSVTQIALGSRVQIALVGDVVCGLGFVWLAWRTREGWPIFLVAIEAMLLLVQTLALDLTGPPTLLTIAAYNVLIMGGPIFLAGIALSQRFYRRR